MSQIFLNIVLFLYQYTEGDGTGLAVVKEEPTDSDTEEGATGQPTEDPGKSEAGPSTPRPSTAAPVTPVKPSTSSALPPPPSPRSQSHRAQLLDAIREMRRGTAIVHSALGKLAKEFEGTPLFEIPDLLKQVVSATKGMYQEMSKECRKCVWT